MSTLVNLQIATQRAPAIFSRIVAGVDGSPESLDAVDQAATLSAPGGTLTLLTAWTLAPPIVTPLAMLPSSDDDERLARSEAERALRMAQERVPTARAMLVHGLSGHALLGEIRQFGATLVAVGSHGRGRAEGLLFGSVTTQLVHDAPCSVLVARRVRARVPRRITVGVDGSPQSAFANAAARYLADRFGSDLAVVVAEGGRPLDLPGAWLIAGDRFRVVPEDPVRALVTASTESDLIVVGSRGLHGLSAFGSVSERVAHRSACSTLIVREG